MLLYYLSLAHAYWSCWNASVTVLLQLAAVFAPYGTADHTAVPHTSFHHNYISVLLSQSQSGIMLQPEELSCVDNSSLKVNMISS